MGAGEGLGFKREGIYVSLWLINVAAWQKPKQHWKATILQFWGKKKKLCQVHMYSLQQNAVKHRKIQKKGGKC